MQMYFRIKHFDRYVGIFVILALALIVLMVMGVLLYQLITPPVHLVDFARSGGGH